MHNRPDDSANRTPPRSSKEPQDTKADEIGLLRQDLASFKTYVCNTFYFFLVHIVFQYKLTFYLKIIRLIMSSRSCNC